MPGFPGPDRAGMTYTGKTPGTGIVAVSGDIMVYPETHGRAASPRWRGMGRTTGDPWRICLRCTISIWGGLPGHGSPHVPHSMQCRHERSMLMPLASPIPPGILITPDRNPIHSLPGDPETPAPGERALHPGPRGMPVVSAWSNAYMVCWTIREHHGTLPLPCRRGRSRS